MSVILILQRFWPNFKCSHTFVSTSNTVADKSCVSFAQFSAVPCSPSSSYTVPIRRMGYGVTRDGKVEVCMTRPQQGSLHSTFSNLHVSRFIFIAFKIIMRDTLLLYIYISEYHGRIEYLLIILPRISECELAASDCHRGDSRTAIPA